MSDWQPVPGTFEDPPRYQVWSRAQIELWTNGKRPGDPVRTRTPGRAHRQMTAIEKRRIVRGYNSGMSVHALSTQFHRGDNTIRNVLAEMGVERRPYSERRG